MCHLTTTNMDPISYSVCFNDIKIATLWKQAYFVYRDSLTSHFTLDNPGIQPSGPTDLSGNPKCPDFSLTAIKIKIGGRGGSEIAGEPKRESKKAYSQCVTVCDTKNMVPLFKWVYEERDFREKSLHPRTYLHISLLSIQFHICNNCLLHYDNFSSYISHFWYRLQLFLLYCLVQ